MANITIKRGDTFSVLCQRVDENNSPLSLSGYTITSKVESVSGFTQTLTVTVVNSTLGQFSINATATETASWPVFQGIDGTTSSMNTLYCDIQYTASPYVESTDTFAIYVVEDIT